MVRRTWGVGGMEADHWKVGGMLITWKVCLFVLQNKKGFQPTLASWARVKATIVCENPNFLDEIPMFVVQSLCCSSTSSTFLVAKSYLTISNLQKGPATVFDFTTADRHAILPAPRTLVSSCLPSGCGTSWMSSCTTTSGELQKYGDRSDPSHAIPGGPWQLVHSWWEPHGSDISRRYLVVFVSNIKFIFIDLPLAIGNPPCMILYVDDPGAANWDGTL